MKYYAIEYADVRYMIKHTASGVIHAVYVGGLDIMPVIKPALIEAWEHEIRGGL